MLGYSPNFKLDQYPLPAFFIIACTQCAKRCPGPLSCCTTWPLPGLKTLAQCQGCSFPHTPCHTAGDVLFRALPQALLMFSVALPVLPNLYNHLAPSPANYLGTTQSNDQAYLTNLQHHITKQVKKRTPPPSRQQTPKIPAWVTQTL